MALFSLTSFRAASARRIERRTAKELAHLSPHLLRDIGLDPANKRPQIPSKHHGRV